MRKLIAAVVLSASFALSAMAAETSQTQDYRLELETLTDGLDAPWSLVFLPDGRMLVSERPGSLKIIPKNGGTPTPIDGVKGVVEAGQGGLLGLALAPDFAATGTMFYCHAAAYDGGVGTAVSRARLNLENNSLESVKRIFEQNPAGTTGRHFGCRLVFDRMGKLFVTTGDRGNMSDAAQDPATGIGKVIRISPDGAPAPGNPQAEGWDPRVWSIGHRNIQGATLHPATGELWTVEHGARGGDEINAPKAGKNYGWPVITYGVDYSGAKIGVGTEKQGMEQPVHYWDPSIAPSGLMIYSGSHFPAWTGNYFVGALRGQAVSRLKFLNGKPVSEERILQDLDERIRDVVQGPDGLIYLLTDSGDGRVIRLKVAD
jgi:glucose/arabinose dehydrogenase